MKKIIFSLLLLITLPNCQSNDQDFLDAMQNSEDPCAEKACNPGYICKDGKCESISRKDLVETLGTCKPKCGLTASCVDGVCIENKVSSLCGGRECLSTQVCDDDECRDKKGCELLGRECTPDLKCHKGDCLPLDSCVFIGCPPEHKCEENACKEQK